MSKFQRVVCLRTRAQTESSESRECRPADSARQYNWKRKIKRFVFDLVSAVFTRLCYRATVRGKKTDLNWFSWSQ